MAGSILALIVVGVMILLVFFILARQGRNKALEQILAQENFGSPEAFRGSLVVEDHRQGSYLKLGRNPAEPRRTLQRAYRWTLGLGHRAPYDGVTFDRSSRTIEMKKNDSYRTTRFEDFTAVRMKEVSLGKSLMFIWLIELIPHNGKPIPIIDSPQGDRRAAFEHAAPLLKAISAVTDLPMQAWIAGNVWTPGWPPKVPGPSA